MMKIRVAVFFGGKTVEHEVSVITALQAIQHIATDKYSIIPIYVTKSNAYYYGEQLLDIDNYKDIPALVAQSQQVTFFKRAKADGVDVLRIDATGAKRCDRFDVAFPIMHGGIGENGAIQGFFDALDIPYVGSNVMASAVAINKVACKYFLSGMAVNIVNWVDFYANDWYENPQKYVQIVKQRLGYPCIIKPSTAGSSIGISKANDDDSLIAAVEMATKYATQILVETCIEDLREINSSVSGSYIAQRVSLLEEPLANDEILSFADKYLNDKTKGMSGLNRIIPAEIDDTTQRYIEQTSRAVFKALGCDGVIRIDYILDGHTGDVYLNEINTIPGSLAFYLWDGLDRPYGDLLDDMIHSAFLRAHREAKLESSFESNLFALNKLGGVKK